MAIYPPQKFSSDGLTQALEVAEKTKFATLVHAGERGLVTVHLPLTIVHKDEAVMFMGHIVKSNPLYDVAANGGGVARVIFQPAHGYVSPSVYSEKEISGKVVPTWNYVAAHFDGDIRLLEGDAALMEVLCQQTDEYEEAHGTAWRVSDAPLDYTQSMSKAIAAIVFEVKACQCIQKLSQNKPEDLERITAWLEAHQTKASCISHWMKRFHGI